MFDKKFLAIKSRFIHQEQVTTSDSGYGLHQFSHTPLLTGHYAVARFEDWVELCV